MEKRVIAINFCGGCNPVIDRGGLARSVKATLAEDGYEVVFNDWDAPFIVRLSGCTAGCAEKYHPVTGPGVAVAGTTLDAVAVDEEALAERVVALARAHFAPAAVITVSFDRRDTNAPRTGGIAPRAAGQRQEKSR